MSRKYLIAGNWKMNKTATEAGDLVSEINSSVGNQTSVQVCVCPAFTALSKASENVEHSEVFLGAQDMNAEPSGAYTGEISAEMLRICMFLLSSWVIVKEGNTMGRQTK